MAFSSAAMWTLTFPRAYVWPLAFVALAPLFVLAVRAQRARAAAAWAFAAGWAAHIVCIFWLRYTTWAGMFALSAYVGLYWPAAVLLLRYVRRRTGLPLVAFAPAVWVALEYLRSWLITGFAWYYAGHALLPNLALSQIADLTGVYGLSWLCVSVAALGADWRLGSFRTQRVGWAWAGALAALLAASHIYGAARIARYDPEPGPRLLLVQGNVPQDLKHSPDAKDAIAIIEDHHRLSLKPGDPVDMIVWPETMMPVPLNLVFEFRGRLGDWFFGVLAEETLAAVARESGAHLLIGAPAEEGEVVQRHYNSAYFITPDLELVGRYDKMHPVAFGEYVPLRRWFPFLGVLRPAIMGPDLSAGSERRIFKLPHDGRMARFGVTICYESAESILNRRYAADSVEFMVNLTNDGWFEDSAELDMHLAVCAFRAIETRKPIARAANTGITAFIDATGRIAERLERDGRDREVEGTLLREIPLADMFSLYVVVGDVFAALASAWATGTVAWAWRRPAARVAEPVA